MQIIEQFLDMIRWIIRWVKRIMGWFGLGKSDSE